MFALLCRQGRGEIALQIFGRFTEIVKYKEKISTMRFMKFWFYEDVNNVRSVGSVCLKNSTYHNFPVSKADLEELEKAGQWLAQTFNLSPEPDTT